MDKNKRCESKRVSLVDYIYKEDQQIFGKRVW